MARPPRYLQELLTELDSTSWRSESAPPLLDSAPDYFDTPQHRQPVAPGRSLREPWRRRPRWWLITGVLVMLLAVGAPVLVGALSGHASPAATPTIERTAEPHPRLSEAMPSATASTDPSSVEPTATATQPSTSTAEPSAKPTAAPGGATALGAIKTLKVGGESGWNNYSRDAFGPAWADIDRNGCDQRNDVLNRDLDDIVHRRGTHNCVVLSGTFHDPYSGRTIHFERGPVTSMEVQIDHVVALADAWHKGAQDWSAARRAAFANDLLNLKASKGYLNQEKSAQDASEWLPPNKKFSCEYVAQQVAVKVKYKLRVTRDERDAMVGVLSTCPGEPVPQD